MSPQPSNLSKIRGIFAVICLLTGAGMWLAYPTSVAAETCDFGSSELPCDPDRGYIWQGACYSDDGCYYTIESCCN